MVVEYNPPTMEKVERAILKLSGELFGTKENNIDFDRYGDVAKQLIEIQDKTRIQLAMVVGGGNIFRGRQANSEVDHIQADYMGMMATIINGIGLKDALVRNGAKDTRLMSPIEIRQVAEPYLIPKARYSLDLNRLVIIAGGLGRANFSTDSAVAQCADELQCQMIFKASTVDGVYDSDPKKNGNAKKYSQITFQEALDRRLKVMDATAFTMCENSGIPIFVFNINDLHRLPEIIEGDYSFGTMITREKQEI